MKGKTFVRLKGKQLV